MITALLALTMAQQPEDLNSGVHLYHSCQAAVRLADKAPSEDKAEDTIKAVECFSYISGLTDGLNMGTRHYCSGKSSYEVLARVYVAFVSANPKLLDHPKFTGMILAFEDAYPCSSK